MRKLIAVALIGALVFALPWRAASASNLSLPDTPRFGAFSYVPAEPTGASLPFVDGGCPACAVSYADAGGGAAVAGASTGTWVLVVLLVVVVAVAASGGGGGGGGGY